MRVEEDPLRRCNNGTVCPRDSPPSSAAHKAQGEAHHARLVRLSSPDAGRDRCSGIDTLPCVLMFSLPATLRGSAPAGKGFPPRAGLRLGSHFISRGTQTGQAPVSGQLVDDVPAGTLKAINETDWTEIMKLTKRES